MKRKTIVAALSGIMVLQGCGTTMKSNEHHRQVQNESRHQQAEYTPRNDIGLVTEEGYYLGDGSIITPESNALDILVGEPGIHTDIPQDISQFARALSEHVRLNIQLASDVYQPKDSGDSIQIRDSAGTEAGRSSSGGGKKSLALIRFSIAPGTTVREALNNVVGKAGLAWKYEEDKQRVLIYRYETAVFDLPIPASTRKVGMSLSGGDLTANMENNQQGIAAVLAAIKSLLSEEGEVTFTDSGSAIVTDTPTSVARVREFIEKEEKKFKRQALLQVRLFTFEKTDAENYSLNWDAVYNGTQNVLSIGGAAPDVTGGVVRSAIEIVNPSSKWNGTVATIDALAQKKGVSIAYENNFLTLSGSPVTASETRKTAYLKSVSGQGAGVSTELVTTTLEPGEIDTGLSMYLHPVINGDDIILNLGFSHTSLVSLTSEESGQNRITTPETAGRETSQTVRLNNGGAVALTGFYVTSADSDDRGVGLSGFKLLGGSSAKSVGQRRAVLVVSANIVE